MSVIGVLDLQLRLGLAHFFEDLDQIINGKLTEDGCFKLTEDGCIKKLEEDV